MKIVEEVYDWAWQPEQRRATKKLILHHAAGSGLDARAIHRLHRQNGWAGIGYHYYVQKDGSIHRGGRGDRGRTDAAGHNADSIGVCFEGNFETEEMGPEQFAAGAELLSDIRDRYPGLTVCGHRDLNATACPGRNFPMERLKEESEMAKLTQEEFNAMADAWLAGLGERAPGDWSREARAWAEETGIIQGDGDGRFRYGSPLTREEYVTMEYRKKEGRA